MGFDTKKQCGPIFRVPVTIIVPIELEEKNNFILQRSIKLKPADSYRLFVHVPHNSSFGRKFYINFIFIIILTKLELKLKSKDSENITKYDVHIMQVIPTVRTKNSEYIRVCFILSVLNFKFFIFRI